MPSLARVILVETLIICGGKVMKKRLIAALLTVADAVAGLRTLCC